MPWFPDPAGGPPIQADTNPNPAGGSYGYYSDPDYSGPPPSTASSSSSTSSSSTPAPTQTVQANNSAVQQLGQQINSLLGAIASGNQQAFNEAVRQFDLSFGLDRDKFGEAIRQFNENLGISAAGLTGTYQGQPTLQARAQLAQLYGTEQFTPGMTTLAAQNQAYNQQLGAIQTAAGLQANPFRQAQVIGQLGGLLRGTGVAGFQAPGQAQGQTDFSGMGNLQRMIDDIRGGPNAINSQSTQGVLDAIPTPNKVDSVNFLRSSPLTQNIVLQGMQEKYGLSPDDALAQIRNTLPQFQAPTTVGTVRR